MAFCPNCGKEVSEGTKFCANCGAPVGAPDSARAASVQEESNDSEKNTGKKEYGESTSTTKDKKIKKSSPILGIAALVLALTGFFGDPPILTVIVSIAAVVLAIISIVKKGKLKGFAIAAVLISAFNLYAVIATGGTYQLPANNESNITQTIADTASATKEHKDINASGSKVSGSSKSSSDVDAPDGVDPKLAAFLNEYEDFIDEYCDFMQKYSKNPTDLKLLAEYADIMEEYAEFADKIDSYDSDSMSTADASYYIEVTTRCTQKMLKVLGNSGN